MKSLYTAKYSTNIQIPQIKCTSRHELENIRNSLDFSRIVRFLAYVVEWVCTQYALRPTLHAKNEHIIDSIRFVSLYMTNKMKNDVQAKVDDLFMFMRCLLLVIGAVWYVKERGLQRKHVPVCESFCKRKCRI